MAQREPLDELSFVYFVSFVFECYFPERCIIAPKDKLMGILYFGDNLDILREHIKDESIDLIYLDPPFNSKQAYNLLFKTPKGQNSDAEITAFEDTWHWGEQAERYKYQFQWWACSLVDAQPYQGRKKGSDTGIDGIDLLQDDNKEAKKIIVSVSQSRAGKCRRDNGQGFDRNG